MLINFRQNRGAGNEGEKKEREKGVGNDGGGEISWVGGFEKKPPTLVGAVFFIFFGIWIIVQMHRNGR